MDVGVGYILKIENQFVSDGVVFFWQQLDHNLYARWNAHQSITYRHEHSTKVIIIVIS